VREIRESCFSGCESLRSITTDPRSRLRKSEFSLEFRERFPMSFCGGPERAGPAVPIAEEVAQKDDRH
jgi:hypothetical protein